MAGKNSILKEINPSKFDANRAANFDVTRAKGNLASRSVPERINNIDAEARTAEFAFASDKPIEHWFGFLKLDTNKEAVILDRITNGVCQHLVNHDPDKVAGVVLSDSISLGSEVRGKSKFSRSTFGSDIFQDIVDEIRNGISFGFLVHELVMESETEGIPTYRATKWEILEVSTVSIPADISVGMGRELYYSSETEETETENQNNSNSDAANRGENSNQKETQMENEEENTPTGENRSANAPASAALTVARELAAFGEILGERELAQDFIAKNGTVVEFQAAVAAKRAKTTPVPPKPVAATQLARTVSRAQVRNFKGENAGEMAYRFGNFLLAALKRSEKAMQFCRDNNIPLTRAHSESDNESGGFLVPEEFEPVMIDLRNEYGVFRRYANVVPMSTETKSRPRRKKGLTAYPIGAVGGSRLITESKKGWDRVSLTAKKWGVLAKYEQELSEDAAISIGDDLAGEIAYAFTIAEDGCGFLGDGTGDYHGIQGVIPKLQSLGAAANVAGIQVASGNAWSEITLADFQALQGKLPQFAYRRGNVNWFASTSFFYNVMEKLALAAGGVTAAEVRAGGGETPRFLGKPVVLTETLASVEANSQIPALYGDLAMGAMFGDRRGTTIAMTDSDGDDFGEEVMTIRGTERFDINVHDVGNAAAQAKDRLAGPIVGLQTAAS